MKILIVDDDRAARRNVGRILERLRDVTIREASSLEDARSAMDEEAFDVALLDMRLSADPDDREGLTLLSDVRARSTVPIIVTGFNDVAQFRTAMKLGAHDYVLKEELNEGLLLPIVEGVRNQRALECEVIALRARRMEDPTLGLVGTSRAMQTLRQRVHRVAVSERPVLVRGPTGAGKELAVRAIHALGPRPEAPLLDLNCGAFPPSLIESQLFGHERGAFTGADRRHDGFFSAVGMGTLFLDEIAELPLDLQAKLLRVLETGTYRAVGSVATKQFAGRVIAATHADLEARVQEHTFREDLLYRLNVLEVWVPSLEERREDIPLLATHFARLVSPPVTFTAEALELLRAAHWPGNVRQLRNLVDRLTVFAPHAPVTPDVAAEMLGRNTRRGRSELIAEVVRDVLNGPEPDKLQVLESALIDEAMLVCGGNKTAAARLLGVHRKIVQRRIDRLSRADR